MKRNWAAYPLGAWIALAFAGIQMPAQEIHAWYYARFLSTEGRIEVCPAGEPGLVVVHSERPNHCLAALLPSKDIKGHSWTEKDYVRLTFRYSAKDGHFKLEGYDYRQQDLLPDWDSEDIGIIPEDLLPAFTGCRAASPLPKDSRIKWVARFELDHKWLCAFVWQSSDGLALNVWIITADESAYKVLTKLPSLSANHFQGLGIMDCLGQGHRDLILYAQSHGAHCTFPEAYLMRVSSLEKQPEYFFTYDDDPSNWLEKTRYQDLSAPPNGK